MKITKVTIAFGITNYFMLSYGEANALLMFFNIFCVCESMMTKFKKRIKDIINALKNEPRNRLNQLSIDSIAYIIL